MTTPASWWAGVPPVELSIDCRGHSHRLAWENGVLSAPDHRGAGPPAACPQGRPAPIGGRGPGRRKGRGGLRRRLLGMAGVSGRPKGPGSRPTPPRRHHQSPSGVGSDDSLARLLGVLDPALERRLQLEVAHTLGARYTAGTSEAIVLEAATVGRLTRTLERSSRSPGSSRAEPR